MAEGTRGDGPMNNRVREDPDSGGRRSSGGRDGGPFCYSALVGAAGMTSRFGEKDLSTLVNDLEERLVLSNG
jgi:hypothetical protein